MIAADLRVRRHWTVRLRAARNTARTDVTRTARQARDLWVAMSAAAVEAIQRWGTLAWLGLDAAADAVHPWTRTGRHAAAKGGVRVRDLVETIGDSDWFARLVEDVAQFAAPVRVPHVPAARPREISVRRCWQPDHEVVVELPGTFRGHTITQLHRLTAAAVA